MKISNQLRDVDRHYLNNILINGTGEIPDEDGKVSDKAEYTLVIEKGFIIGAIKIVRGNKDAN